MSTLEHRYRRLLRWYPADHRRRHEDEMLGVLMDSAEPGRERPAARDAANLLAGAVRIRFRRVLRLSPQDRRDALALASVIAPVLLAVGLVVDRAGLYGMDLVLGRFPYSAPAGQVVDVVVLPGVGLTPDWLLYMTPAVLSVPVAVLALRGARRPAAVLAWLLLAAMIAHGLYLASGVEWYSGNTPIAAWQSAFQNGMPALLPLATAVLLSVPSDPLRGRALIGAARLTALGLTAAPVFVCEFHGMAASLPAWYQFAGPIVFAFWAGRAMAAPAGRGAALLLAVPVAMALPSLTPMGAGSGGMTWTHFYPHVLLAPAAVVFAAVAWWTAGHRAGRQSGGEPAAA